jgi:hypothetical protein
VREMERITHCCINWSGRASLAIPDQLIQQCVILSMSLPIPDQFISSYTRSIYTTMCYPFHCSCYTITHCCINWSGIAREMERITHCCINWSGIVREMERITQINLHNNVLSFPLLLLYQINLFNNVLSFPFLLLYRINLYNKIDPV